MLAHLYAERRYFDLALRHQEIHLQLVRQAGSRSGEDEQTFADRIDRLEVAVQQLRIRVQDRENRFVLRSYALTADPLARARIALELDLAGKALDEVLLKSHSDLYGVEGLRMILELMLTTGRAQEAGELLARPEFRQKPEGLGVYELAGVRQRGQRISYRFPAFDWFSICQSAATGNYDQALGVLERLRNQLEREETSMVQRLRPGYTKMLASEIGLRSAWRIVPPSLFVSLDNERVSDWLVQGRFMTVERADLHVLEGMLLLERGRPTQAGQHFSRSLKFYASARDSALVLPGLPLAQRYLERIRFFAVGP